MLTWAEVLRTWARSFDLDGRIGALVRQPEPHAQRYRQLARGLQPSQAA